MTTTATKKLEKKLVVFNMFKAHFENDKTESSFENALAAAGVSRATLMRYKADLKKAGMIIDSHGHALLYAEAPEKLKILPKKKKCYLRL